MLLFAASDFTSITSHIHKWAVFLLWLHLFILSGVISPLFSSNILGTNQLGEFIFKCHIFLPFHIFHGILKAKILKWFAVPFSRGPRFVRTLRCDPVALHCMAHSFVVATHSGKQTHSEGQCRWWSALYYTSGPKEESPLSQGPQPTFVKTLYTLSVLLKPTSPNSLN